jgi:hypothetical protein
MKLKAISANFRVGESGVCQADHRDAVLDRTTDLLQLCKINGTSMFLSFTTVERFDKRPTCHGNRE